MRLFRIILFIAVLLLCAFFVWAQKQNSQKMAELGDYGSVGEFALIDQGQQPYGNADLKGRVWVANFFFSRCQGPCPLLMANMAKLQKTLAGYPELRYVSVSIDPLSDTPEVLGNYSKELHADGERWHLLSGEKDKIFHLARSGFKLSADENPDLHTTTFVLVDKNMLIRGYFDGKDPEALAKLADAAKVLAK
jgi:protein SCO1/2